MEIDVSSSGPALLAIDQSYFRAWSARMGDRELATTAVNLDRLGVVVPGSGTVTLRFGRYRMGVVVGWVVSSLLLIALLMMMRVGAPAARRRYDRKPSKNSMAAPARYSDPAMTID
jgi:hypothetical protein